MCWTKTAHHQGNYECFKIFQKGKKKKIISGIEILVCLFFKDYKLHKDRDLICFNH